MPHELRLLHGGIEGKSHTVAGEWASIPVIADKSLFEAMVEVGKTMVNIERKEDKAKDFTLTAVFYSLKAD